MVEAGCTVIGGHSIRDPEIKFGYAVTGTINPKRVLANAGAKAGDSLILTKALGTGVISTAIKRGEAREEWVAAATRLMTTLNKAAADVVANPEAKKEKRFKVRAMTDVTGFGLIGHAREMALASDVSLRIDSAKVPLLPGALECVRAGFVPGGLIANREFAECAVSYKGAIAKNEELKTMLFDPQTAGGLLISVSAKQADELIAALGAAGVAAAAIGKVTKKGPATIVVT